MGQPLLEYMPHRVCVHGWGKRNPDNKKTQLRACVCPVITVWPSAPSFVSPGFKERYWRFDDPHGPLQLWDGMLQWSSAPGNMTSVLGIQTFSEKSSPCTQTRESGRIIIDWVSLFICGVRDGTLWVFLALGNWPRAGLSEHCPEGQMPEHRWSHVS